MTNGWALIVYAALSTAIANLCLRAGILRAGGFELGAECVISKALSLLTEPRFDIGIVFYALAALIWFRVLSVMEVSSSYPVLVSVTFVLVSLGSSLFFNEHVSWMKVVGMGVIIAGIVIVSRS